MRGTKLMIMAATIFMSHIEGLHASSSTDDSWCVVNENKNDGGLNDWQTLSPGHVHLVRASKQDEAKKKLEKSRSLRISDKQANDYLQDGDDLKGGSFVYLVQAASLSFRSLDVGDHFKADGPFISSFYGSFSASRKKLAIINGNLGNMSKPFNMALIVDLNEDISDYSSACLSAK